EHPGGPQRHRVHPVLVLSVARAGAAAKLVQEPALPRPDGARAAQASQGDGSRATRVGRGARLGFERGDSLSRPARAPTGDRRDERGGPGTAGHPRRDDRGRAAMSGGIVRQEIADMRGQGALPRTNGELVFAAPWEGRALAMAIGAVQSLGLPWDEFRLRLIGEIARDPERPYYESWLAALERLVAPRRARSRFGRRAGRAHSLAVASMSRAEASLAPLR